MRPPVFTRDQMLRAIHELQSGDPTGIARTSDLAARLGVADPSITGRVQALAAEGLARYVPRRGTTLTPLGERQAISATRRLRLIERFLGEVLAMPDDVAAGEAERLARWASDRVMDGFSRCVEAGRGRGR